MSYKSSLSVKPFGSVSVWPTVRTNFTHAHESRGKHRNGAVRSGLPTRGLEKYHQVPPPQNASLS